MTKESPTVSVLMTVYNEGLYLREAIDSILRQEFTDFEFIIINDGSTDNSQDIIDHYARIDSRIVPINQKNQGLVASLNTGVQRAKGKYIARMDADDVSMSQRLSDQVTFMDNSPNVVLLGGGFEIIDEMGYFLERIHVPLYDRDIRRTMLLRNPFGHASVMFRRDAIKKAGLYSDKCGPTEDFELWIRLKDYGKVAALPRPLYEYRIKRNGISLTASEIQMKYTEQHIDQLWKTTIPSVLSRRELIAQSKRYLRAARHIGYGVGIKHQFLSDNAQIGMKLIRYGHFWRGFRQMLNVASTGRAGLRITLKRLKIVAGGLIRRLLGRG